MSWNLGIAPRSLLRSRERVGGGELAAAERVALAVKE